MKNLKIPIVYLFTVLFFTSCGPDGSKADNDFDVSVNHPQLTLSKPKICFDESHKEHHKIDNTYKPFARLIANDGCIVTANKKLIDKTILADTDIYAIITAMGKEDPGDISPFSPEEISTLENWVKNGGCVLLITEHYPFGLSMSPLLNKFGIHVHNGYTEDTLLTDKNAADALLFEKSEGNLNQTHPICQGIERVNTFTGSSIKGDSTCIPLLMFTNNAQNFNVKVNVKKSGGDITTSVEYADFYSAKGYCQALCKNYGKGKMVVLAESALLTAQTDKNGNKFGMNVPNTDNKQFGLNVIRWLATRH